MEQHTAKRVAKVKLTLTKRTVEALEPQDKPWIAWDDRLTGFGWRVWPRSCSATSRAATIPPESAPSAGALPTLGDACEEYIDAGHGRAAAAQRSYRRYANLYLGDWLACLRSTPLPAGTSRLASTASPSATARCRPTKPLSFLRSVYRRPCVDYDGLPQSGRAAAASPPSASPTASTN